MDNQGFIHVQNSSYFAAVLCLALGVCNVHVHVLCRHSTAEG